MQFLTYKARALPLKLTTVLLLETNFKLSKRRNNLSPDLEFSVSL